VGVLVGLGPKEEEEVIHYVPTYEEDGDSTWEIISGGSYDYLSSGGGSGGLDNTYLMDADRNTSEMYTNLKGDICQYLGKTDAALNGYRMPIANEFPTGSEWVMGDGSFVHTPSASYADGRADFLSSNNGAGIKLGSAIHPSTGLVLPAAGYKTYYEWVSPSSVGGEGQYRTASISFVLFFNSAEMRHMNQFGSYYVSIRCIRKLPGDP
jgi:hypothetical protein